MGVLKDRDELEDYFNEIEQEAAVTELLALLSDEVVRRHAAYIRLERALGQYNIPGPVMDKFYAIRGL